MPNDKPMYPAVQITRSNPTVAAALSKMETAPGRTVMYRDGDRVYRVTFLKKLFRAVKKTVYLNFM